MPKVFAFVLAAGQGTRIGEAVPKQYIPVAGRPMMFHSIETLASVPRIERVFVVLAPLDRHWGQHDWSALPDKVEGIFCGGSTGSATGFLSTSIVLVIVSVLSRPGCVTSRTNSPFGRSAFVGVHVTVCVIASNFADGGIWMIIVRVSSRS